MRRRSPRRRARWWRRPVPLMVLVLLVALATGGGLVLAGVLRLPQGSGDAPTVAAPVLQVPPVPTPSPVLDPATGPPLTPGGLAAAVGTLARDPALGPSVGISVTDPATGTVLFAQGATSGRTPASTAKLLTAAAALRLLGPDTRLATRVVEAAPDVLVIVGGGDATLRSAPGEAGEAPRRASLTELARSTAAALRRAAVASPSGPTGAPAAAPSPAASAAPLPPRPVVVRVDDSLFSGPAASPGWPAGYVASGVVAPVHALSVDSGRAQTPAGAAAAAAATAPRVPDPALDAGQRFAALLRAAGVPVTGTVTRAVAPRGALELAEVQSPTVAELVELDLETSDDDLAEALGHLVGAADGGAGTFVTGAAGTTAALSALGVPTAGIRLLDASGLARGNAVPAATLTALLATAARPGHPELGPVLSGLPVAGWSGTLADRFSVTPPGVRPSAAPGRAGSATSMASPVASAEGRVRAKTGTLTGVSGLAGTVLDSDGRLSVFAVLADAVPDGAGTLEARAALDRFAAALAACGCRTPPTAVPSSP